MEREPASRMKAGREHRVPLAARCLDLLQQAKLLGAGNEFVFPGRSNDSTRSASTPGKRDSRPRSAQAVTAALDCWFAFEFQGSRSATLLAG